MDCVSSNPEPRGSDRVEKLVFLFPFEQSNDGRIGIQVSVRLMFMFSESSASFDLGTAVLTCSRVHLRCVAALSFFLSLHLDASSVPSPSNT